MTSARAFAKGQRVTTRDTVRPVRFAGRRGRVARINRPDNEVGVDLTAGARAPIEDLRAEAWFRPDELDAADTPTPSERHSQALDGHAVPDRPRGAS